jgi:acetylornithine deacetylase
MDRKSIKIDRENVVGLMKSLITIESINPSVGGLGESRISEFVADYLEKVGLDVQTQQVVGDRYNVIGTLRGENSNRSLMMNGHLDTVGVKGMVNPPFEPFVKNGRIHGRGACDMKGPLAAMIASIQALIKAKARLDGDLQISAVVDEEYLSLGTNRLLEEFRPDAAIVGEPTNMKIGIVHNGIVRVEVETRGKAAHGSVPEKGVDAITEMAKFVLGLEELKKEYANRSHELVGVPKLHTSLIEGGTEWNIVPDFCLLKVERRTIPGETALTFANECKSIFKSLSKADPSFEAKMRVVLDKQAMEIDPHEAVVESVQKAFREVRGTEPQITGEPYWTDASLFVNKAHVPTCLFAPGDIAVSHSRNEYIEIEDVVESARIYALAAMNFFERDG